MSREEIINSAIAKYVAEKGGYDFYESRIDRGATKITKEGYVSLFKIKTMEKLVTYQIDELGLTADVVNALHRPGTHECATGDLIGFEMINSHRKTVGLLGSAMLLLGSLCPIVSLPVVGSINYVHNGRGDGLLIIAISIASIYFALCSKYSQLRRTGLASLAIISTSLWMFQIRISELKSSLDRDLDGNPFRGIADLAFSSVRLEWGWILLIGGSLTLITLSCLVKTERGLILPRNALILESGSYSRNLPLLVGLTVVAGLVFALILNGLGFAS